ncbi:MAG TPA: hypothetical protein VLA13_05800 [Massilibacterium sp.]|nr:hypothetical protein [Massilibacterium sp.]
MMKYKLIKEYPNSPPEGTIVELTGDAKCICNSGYIDKNTLKENPEFWEEVVEKDYKILSFKSDINIVELRDAPKVMGYHSTLTEKSALEDDYWNIHSVKRISDGEVFTVGDEVGNGVYNGDITKFRETEEGLDVVVSDAWVKDLRYIEHTKHPLFTTEDGVDIYEGDEYFVITKYMGCYGISNYTCTKNKHSHYKTFSTKEKAEEWIDNNKPRYNKEEIYKALTCIEVSGSGTVEVNFNKFWETLNGN